MSKILDDIIIISFKDYEELLKHHEKEVYIERVELPDQDSRWRLEPWIRVYLKYDKDTYDIHKIFDCEFNNTIEKEGTWMSEIINELYIIIPITLMIIAGIGGIYVICFMKQK